MQALCHRARQLISSILRERGYVRWHLLILVLFLPLNTRSCNKFIFSWSGGWRLLMVLAVYLPPIATVTHRLRVRPKWELVFVVLSYLCEYHFKWSWKLNLTSLMIVCGAIGIAGGTARGGEWEDGQLAHGIIATIAVLAFVFLTVNLAFLSLNAKLFGRTSKEPFSDSINFSPLVDCPQLTNEQRNEKKWTCILLGTFIIEILCCLTSIILVEWIFIQGGIIKRPS